MSEIKKLLNILEKFRKLNPNMPLQQVQTFLYICEHEKNPEGVTIKDISEALGFSHASASRNVAAFSSLSRHRTEGYNLVEAAENIMLRSQKKVTLTAKGRNIRNSIKKTLSSGQ